MNKYHARATIVDGVRFASQKEAARYGDLCLRERAGEITDLIVHPTWELIVTGARIGTYTADFSYLDLATGRRVVEDVKSVPTRTEAYRLRVKLLRALYGIAVVEVC